MFNAVPLIPRTHLFGNPAKAGAQISPDGRYLAWLAPVMGVLNIWVSPAAAPQEAGPVTDDRYRGIRSYCWTYDGRHLVYLQDENGNEDFHVHLVDPSAGVGRNVTPFPGVRAMVMGVSSSRRDELLIGMNRRDPKYIDLRLLRLSTGELTLLEENTEQMAGYVADSDYHVRFATRLGSDGSLYVLRRDTDRCWMEWRRWCPEDARNSGITSLNRTGTAVFLRNSQNRDTAALERVDLVTGETAVLASDARADIGGTLVTFADLEPLAYSVTVERREYVALDPSIEADLAFLAAQRIGDWDLQSRTEDDQTWILGAASDTMPVAAYRYDRPARTLTKLYDARPDLTGAPLVAMRPVTINARDGLALVCYLSRPAAADRPGPMVLLVHGGPWSRDVFGYHAQHQWLANRGYAVLSVNFRGSTGFGKRFVNAGDHEWGERMDDDLLDAVAWAVGERVADPARVAIMGVSYGGYAVLAGMTRNPEFYACGVDVVGPSNLETLVATIPPYWEAVRSQLLQAVGNPATPDGLALKRERSPCTRQAGSGVLC